LIVWRILRPVWECGNFCFFFYKKKSNIYLKIYQSNFFWIFLFFYINTINSLKITKKKLIQYIFKTSIFLKHTQTKLQKQIIAKQAAGFTSRLCYCFTARWIVGCHSHVIMYLWAFNPFSTGKICKFSLSFF
jgi:hypothetical protein